MSDAWQSYSGAPALGTRLCALDDIPDGGTRCLDLAGFPILLVRNGAEVRGFVNACPHQYLPLNYRGEQVLSADGTQILCTNHGAAFCARTGAGVKGLGLGEELDPIPVSVGAEGEVTMSQGANG